MEPPTRVATLCLAAQMGDQRARQQLIDEHEPFIQHVVHTVHPLAPLEGEDALQSGKIGFDSAVMRFKPTKGVKLTTFAYPWVRGEVQKERQALIGTPRLPTWMQDVLRKYHQALFELRALGIYPPTREQIAEHLGCNLEAVVTLELNAVLLDSVSLCAQLGESGSMTVEDTLAAMRDRGTVALTDDECLLWDAWRRNPHKTQKEYAAELGWSQAKVSRIENDIEAKVRRGGVR